MYCTCIAPKKLYVLHRTTMYKRTEPKSTVINYSTLTATTIAHAVTYSSKLNSFDLLYMNM